MHKHHDDLTHLVHHKLMIQDFKKRFLFALILTIPILVLSPMIQSFFRYDLRFFGDTFLLFILSTIIFFYGGWPFLKGLYTECKTKKPGMMTLIGVAITVAYGYSTVVVFGFSGKMFFWELVTLIDIMLIGHWLEMSSILGASRSLELLVEMMPVTAHLIKDREIRDVALEELNVNDYVLIKPGEKIPADGTVIEGSSYINEAMLTGESRPVKKIVDSNVIGGSINGQGSLRVKVTHLGKNSYLAKVINLVEEAQKSKSKTELLADRAARWLTFIALAAGFVTLVSWIFLGKSFEFSLERMVTVMVISCPHALGLAIPLVVAISTSLSAQHGLLIRNRTAFESSRKITTLVFDKTGTLTEGNFSVTHYESLDNAYSKDDIIKYAGSLERHSEHPIAVSIVEFLKNRKIEMFNAENFQAITGQGAEAIVNGKNIKVVSPLYLQINNMSQAVVSDDAARTTVFVLIDGKVSGYIVLADQIRKESFDAIKTFKKNGIRTIMLTGDNKKVAKVVSEKLGLDDYYAEVLPHQKLEIIKKLQNQGEFVAMVGDGINDAPALAKADIGIAVGSGADIAAETADIILVKSNPRNIASLILFGRATYKKMVQNLLWATGYNAFAIPLAAGVLYYYGIVLSPAIGAVLMSLSTVVVAFNATLLRRGQTPILRV